MYPIKIEMSGCHRPRNFPQFSRLFNQIHLDLGMAANHSNLVVTTLADHFWRKRNIKWLNIKV